MGVEGKDDFRAAPCSCGNNFLGTGVLWPSLARCQLCVPGTKRLRWGRRKRPPHTNTRTMLKGRREPAGCHCSCSVLLPGATLLTASLAPAFFSSLRLSVRLHTQGDPPASGWS